MSRNWIRSCSLIVSGSGGASKDLSSLRVVFKIKQWHSQAPNMASFRVYNISPTTRAAFAAAEFTQIQFSAGYQDNVGVIFSGNIKQTIYGHETAVDTYIDIFAADGEQGYNQARVSKALASGWTPKDKLQAAVDALSPYGISLGVNTLSLAQPQYPRGIPLIGMARDIVRNVVLSAGGIWSIQLGQLMITDKTLQGASSNTITLNGYTGMIGWPRQTQDGIVVQSLLNPALQPLMQVNIDPSSIIAAEQNNNPITGPGSQENLNLANQALAAGTYTIFHMDRSGDTRGQDWYDESMCIGVGGALSANQLNNKYSLGYS